MDNIKSVISLSHDDIRRWATNPRIYVIAIFIFLIINSNIAPIISFSKMVDIGVTPWVFPFILSDPFLGLCIMLCAVLLFCDAPFFNNGTPFVFMRSGRKKFFLGKVMYIVNASVIYSMFIMIVSLVCTLPHIELNRDWGKVLGTLAQTDAGNQYEISLVISNYIQINYTPLQSMAFSFLLLCLVIIFIGMIIFLFNIWIKGMAGPVAGGVVSFFHYFVYNDSSFSLFKFSPASWLSLDFLDATGRTSMPSLSYAITMLLVLILSAIILSYIGFRKIQIQVLPTI